jgi:phospholipase C
MQAARTGLVSAAIFQLASATVSLPNFPRTSITRQRHRTPIKHVIVIIGENRSFDHVFATYVPKKGEKVWNLLSRRNCERRRNARPELLQGRAKGSHRSAARCFLLNPSQDDVSWQRASRAARWRTQDSYVKNDSLTLRSSLKTASG